MAKDLQKLIDSSDSVSLFGRADRYQAEHPLKPFHSKDVVGGADSTIDQFAIIKQYHLKGFEYGTWVSNNDRYDHLLAAQRSLKHLAQIRGSENIGINGNVGIAFGGRGQGGSAAAAHYEPSFNMINLTKPSGAGCLTHEYGHALDYNFGSFVVQNKSYAALSGGHSTSQTLETNVGGQLRAMINELLDAIIQTESHQQLREKVKGDYWIRRTEIFARFFEQYICYKMRKIATDDYLTQRWHDYTHSRAYLTEADFNKVHPLAEKLNAELGKFLNGRGKLKTTPYPSSKKLVPVKKVAAKKATPAKKTNKS
ncbi:MAG: hypothetical protein IJ235_06465 [Eubacterium sp.]|nr:hypothetical protein [Eubacterium sp.]